jgi:tripartite-type tricarboxylate transporter receptor subunit TctC
MKRRILVCTAAAVLAAGAAFALPAAAQAAWPTGRPVSYVVPFAAGGTTDTLARLIGQ